MHTGQKRQSPASSSLSPQASDVVFRAYGIVPSANTTALRGLLEPTWRAKGCEAVGSYADDEEPFKKVVEMLPWNRRQKQRMQRQWWICVDGKDLWEEGVLLAYFS